MRELAADAASFRGDSALRTHVWRPCPQEILRYSTRTITSYLFVHEYLYDSITISKGEPCVLRHGLSRQHQHTLNSHSRPDALHTLPLTTILGLCRVVRLLFSTTNLLGQLLPEHAQRALEQAARGERESSSDRRSPRDMSIA